MYRRNAFPQATGAWRVYRKLRETLGIVLIVAGLSAAGVGFYLDYSLHARQFQGAQLGGGEHGGHGAAGAADVDLLLLTHDPVASALAALGAGLAAVGLGLATAPRLRTRGGLASFGVSAALLGDAVIHLLAIGEHIEVVAYQGFFAAVAIGQVILGLAIATTGRRPFLALALASSLGLITVYLYALTFAAPLHNFPESPGALGVTSKVLEASAIVLALPPLLQSMRERRPARSGA